MKKTVLFAFAAMIVFYQGIVKSQEIKPSIKKLLEVDKWITQKQKLVERAICLSLEMDIEHPRNPAHYSSSQLSYELLAETSKKYIAPSMSSITGLPYSERDSLVNVPTPSIESLSCTNAVEIWRAMYEYKTIPYKEVVSSPFDKFMDGVFYWIKKIYDFILIVAFEIFLLSISIVNFYGTIKLTRKDSSCKFLKFTLVLFPISVVAIPPLYFPWAYWSHNGSFFTYFIGCLIFIAVMIFVYLIRKYR